MIARDELAEALAASAAETTAMTKPLTETPAAGRAAMSPCSLHRRHPIGGAIWRFQCGGGPSSHHRLSDGDGDRVSMPP